MDVDAEDVAEIIDDILGDCFIRASAVVSVGDTLYWLHISRVHGTLKMTKRIDGRLRMYAKEVRSYLCHMADGEQTLAFAYDAMTEDSWFEKPTMGNAESREWFQASPDALDFLVAGLLAVEDEEWSLHDSKDFEKGKEIPPPTGWRELFEEE